MELLRQLLRDQKSQIINSCLHIRENGCADHLTPQRVQHGASHRLEVGHGLGMVGHRPRSDDRVCGKYAGERAESVDQSLRYVRSVNGFQRMEDVDQEASAPFFARRS